MNNTCQRRCLTGLFLTCLQTSVFLTTTDWTAIAQPLENKGQPIFVPPPPPPSVAPSLTLPSPPASPNPQFNRYRLGTGDGVAVSVQRFPDLNFQATINQEGNIVVPLLGTVSLEGLTLDEAQEKIRLGLNRFVINPVITLTLAAPRPVQITITGEVPRPGIYPVGLAARVSDALVVAGGTTMLADLRFVQVRRTLFDGSVISQTVDLYSPLQNNGVIPNLRLQDGDAIIVPKREIGTEKGYDRNLVARSTLAQQQIRVRVFSYANSAIGTIQLPSGSNFVDALTAVAPNPDNINLNHIALIRFDPERGRAITRRLNGKRALLGDASQNIPMQDNDVIVIGRNLIGKITYALSLISQPFASVFSFLGFFNNFNNIGF